MNKKERGDYSLHQLGPTFDVLNMYSNNLTMGKCSKCNCLYGLSTSTPSYFYSLCTPSLSHLLHSYLRKSPCVVLCI